VSNLFRRKYQFASSSGLKKNTSYFFSFGRGPPSEVKGNGYLAEGWDIKGIISKLKGEVETEDEEPKNLPSRSSSKQDEPAFR
jgi:hypothetical protein